MSEFKKHYPYACEVQVPIRLKIPVCLDIDVVGQKPACHIDGAYKYPDVKSNKVDQPAPVNNPPAPVL